MASPAEIVDTLATVAEVNGWIVYRLHGSRTDPARAAAPDLELVRPPERLVVKVQSEKNAKTNGLSDKQRPHLDAMAATGAEVLHVTTAAKVTEAAGALSLSAALERVQRSGDPQ